MTGSMTERLRTRLAALVAKGRDAAASEAEATACIAMAARLAAEAGMTLDVDAFEREAAAGDAMGDITIHFKGAADFAHQRLARAVASVTGTSAWKVARGMVRYVGYRPDVEMAEWLLRVCVDAVVAEGAAWKARTKATSQDRNDFAVVMCARLNKRLHETFAPVQATAQASEGGRALVLAKAVAVEAWRAELLGGATLRSARSRRKRFVSKAALEDGRAAADRVGFGRPGDACSGRALIER